MRVLSQNVKETEIAHAAIIAASVPYEQTTFYIEESDLIEGVYSINAIIGGNRAIVMASYREAERAKAELSRMDKRAAVDLIFRFSEDILEDPSCEKY